MSLVKRLKTPEFGCFESVRFGRVRNEAVGNHAVCSRILDLLVTQRVLACPYFRMRTWIMILLLTGCGSEDAGFPVGQRTSVLRSSGIVRPQILYPRHRILSPVPLVLIAVPADPSPVTVTLVTEEGLRWETCTIRRAIPWPPGARLLRPLERGFVILDSSAGKARAGFVHVPPRLGARPFKDLRQEMQRYAGRGYPMEALRLWVGARWRPDESMLRLARRAGFPVGPLW